MESALERTLRLPDQRMSGCEEDDTLAAKQRSCDLELGKRRLAASSRKADRRGDTLLEIPLFDGFAVIAPEIRSLTGHAAERLPPAVIVNSAWRRDAAERRAE